MRFEVEISDMIGSVLTQIERVPDDSDQPEEVYLRAEDGREWRMIHYRDCCESVLLEDVVGDLDDLIGSEILEAYSSSSTSETLSPADPLFRGGSFTWTFYVIRTVRGSVTLRWLGESNGYYSEDVSFERLRDVDPESPAMRLAKLDEETDDWGMPR